MLWRVFLLYYPAHRLKGREQMIPVLYFKLFPYIDRIPNPETGNYNCGDTIVLVPMALEAQVNLLVNHALAEVRAIFFRDLLINPENIKKRNICGVAISINGKPWKTFCEFDSPDISNLDDRIFDVTSKMADKLKSEICRSILEQEKFKALILDLGRNRGEMVP